MQYISTVLPIEDVFPFLFSEEKFVIEKPSTEAVLTKSSTASTMTFTVYSKYEFILTPIEIALTSYSSSALRQSLNYSDDITLIGNGPYYIRFLAFTKYIYFTTSPVSLVVATPGTNDNIGINPDKMPSTINNSTSLSMGFSVEALAEGVVYQLTTYALELSTDGSASGITGIMMPILSGRTVREAYEWGDLLT